MPSTLAHNLDIQTIEISPTKMEKVVLGRFNIADAEPKFRVLYHERDPESPNLVSYHDEPIYDHEHGTYLIIRHFQSFSQRIHRITVRFASEADKALDID